MAADLAGVCELVQARDLALPLDPRRMVWRQVADQRPDAVTQLQREVGGGGAHQLADVVDRDLSTVAKAVGMLGLAHCRCCGTGLCVISAAPPRAAYPSQPGPERTPRADHRSPSRGY